MIALSVGTTRRAFFRAARKFHSCACGERVFSEGFSSEDTDGVTSRKTPTSLI